MYKPVPHGSCKSDLRHHRNRRLALVKKRAIRLVQTIAARRAIPHYFQKRIKQHTLLAKKSASTSNCSTNHGPTVDESVDTHEERTRGFALDFASETLTPDYSIQETEEGHPATPEEPLDSPTAESKALFPKTTIIDRIDTLSTIKEYYSIQSAIRLLLAMLQERMEEVESMQKKSITAESKEADNAGNSAAEAVAILTEDDPHLGVPEIKIEANNSSQHTTATADPNKENNVPLEKNKLETTLAPVADALNRANSTPVKDEPKEEARPYSFLEASKSDILDPTYTCDIELEPLENRKNRSIVDSLLNKFNLSPPAKATIPPSFSDNSGDGIDGRRSLRDRTKIAARPRYIEIPEEPRKLRVSKVFGKLHKTLNIELDCTNSNSSTEFYGFDEGEIVKLDKPSLPGLLPTPIVKKSQPYAPFLTYGSSMDTDNAETGTEPRSDLFREEGLISFGSLPPRLECPQRPNDMVRPRTVAQKRILVQRENDIRYLMIDNESKIFQFLKKRSKNIDAALDFCRMKELQDQQIPFTRDTWRALSWLRTEKGRYYFQTMNIDNRTIKLSGCLGNHRYKTVSRHPLYSSPVIATRGHRYHYVSNCHCPPFPEGITLNISQDADSKHYSSQSEAEWKQRMGGDNSRYLYRGSPGNTDHQNKRSYPGTKPGPLSSKCVQPTPDDDPCLGQFEVFKMPPVELEVFPKLNRPLDGFVKPYLKLILPHDGITENWARFAVSTLTANGANGEELAVDENEERSFVFEVPYLNNQRRMLIRRRFLASPGTPMHIGVEQFKKLMEEKLTFRKVIDDALAAGKDDEIDPDELVCADVLSTITDSVAIALAEDVFVKDDPDVDYPQQKGISGSSQEQMTKPIKIETPVTGSGMKAPCTPSPTVASHTDVCSGASDGTAATTAVTECSKTIDPVKQKLLREMKRLNATIIEDPSETSLGACDPVRQQRCDPQYCSLGCICDVLHSTQPSTMASMQRRQHCARNDCIFGCTCDFAQKRANQTQEVKMEHPEDENGEAISLSSADVKYLREKATARLAKVERDFTPTIILTKNTTVLVHNKESESRRPKKKPKKYDDYYNEQSVQSLLNGSSAKDVSQYISKPPQNAKPLSEADRMRHAHVVLYKLPQLINIEPLCMVHDIYRCFCGGTATTGKPFSFTEESCSSMAPKACTTTVPHSLEKELILTPVNGTTGRMTKGVGGTQVVAKNRTKETESVVHSSYETMSVPLLSIANVRKRLYSFEKANNEAYDSNSSVSGSPDGKSSKGHQGTVAKKRRDSSEESYKPPNERKAAKKKLHSSFEDKSDATTATESAIRARRASVAPSQMAASRRPSVAVGESRKGATLAMRRASVAHPSHQKEANAFKMPGKSDTTASNSSVDDAQYTVVKPKNASGVSGINSIIIKRIPAQNMTSEATEIARPASKKAMPPKKTKVGDKTAELNVPPVKYMSVRKLRQLMIAEYKNAPDVKGTTDDEPIEATPAFVNILLLDTEENIDNEPQLNILTDKTKKLIINGNRRSFIESKSFINGLPPPRTMPHRNRTTYIVQILSASSVAEVEIWESKATKTDGIMPQPSFKPTCAPSSAPRTAEPPKLKVKPAIETQVQVMPPAQKYSGTNTNEQADRSMCSLMRHINELLRRTTLNISPPKKGILYICRWIQLLDAFAIGEIDVLDLTLTNGVEMTVIATAPFKQQLVPDVQRQISARRLTIDKMIRTEHPSLLMKMVVCHVENSKTKDLALMLYGNQHFWQFCGFLKVDEKSFKTDSNILPSPSTQTSGSLRTRLDEYYRKTFIGEKKPASEAKQQAVVAASTTTTVSKQPPSSLIEPAPSTSMLSTQSNIEILPKAMQPVHFPLGLLPGIADPLEGALDCRWMRLKIENDFSHMYLPSWQCCVTYGRIKKAIYDANRLAKPMRLDNPAPTRRNEGHQQQRPFMYALPKEGHALFLGPYQSTDTKIDVILCQSVQGSLYEREVYERQHGITAGTNTKRTVGWWVDSITSRVASVKDKLSITGPKVDRLLVNNNSQRSLLKRNNIPATTVSVVREKPTAGTINIDVEDQNNLLNTGNGLNDVDDDVVLVESNEVEDNASPSSAEEPILQNREVPDEQLGMVLFRLVEGTMKQTQQEKLEIEKVWQQQKEIKKNVSSSTDAIHNEQKRKRKPQQQPPVVLNCAPAAKVVRWSDSGIVQDSVKQLQQKPTLPNSTNAVSSATTIARNNFTRISLPSPQTLKIAANAITKPINATSTLTIGQLKPTEVRVPVKLVHSTALRIVRKSTNTPPGLPARASSTTKVIFNNVPSQSTVGASKPRPRLNSVAVERVQSRPAPVVQKSDDEDEVVWLDDDNNDASNDARESPVASATTNQERGTTSSSSSGTAPISTVTSSSNGTASVLGQKTILSQEQIAMIARRVDLTKTGQQDGYSFNPASGLLKMKRSLLNSIEHEEMLNKGNGTTEINTVKSTAPPKAGPSSVNGVKARVVTGSVTTLLSNSATKPTILPTPSPSVNGRTETVARSSTVTISTKPIVPSTSTTPAPTTTITMPRTKVVPRVVAMPGEVPARRISDGGKTTDNVTPPGTAASIIGLVQKYLSEAQEEKQLSEKPHTRGILESKIPGLGLVEVVRFEREVIIHIKELTVKKQLVSVHNLEDAVSLLNQFIQRNTYAFRPHNLTLQWEFKERSLPLRPEEKLTSVINQYCIVTMYGIIDLSKADQLQAVESTLPKLYEDLMTMKLAMQCFNKQRYEEEKCYESDDKIYDRAVEVITTMNTKQKWLQQQRETCMKLRRVNQAKLRQLKGDSSSTSGAKDTKVAKVAKIAKDGKEAKTTAKGANQESVIVIDDD
uniref:MGA conserved domain-containing protein n=1 Tax=Anopheles epiroticus TaxID=199890 RepID=A0A182PN51_9DIPT